MKYWAWRRRKKQAKHLLHEARHARAYREDLAAPADLGALEQAVNDLHDAVRLRDERKFDAAAEAVTRSVLRVYPPRDMPVVREYVEIVAVALAAAMAFRTYFIQPFKIPTGSMQPTLYGIIVDPEPERTFLDAFPLNYVQWALFGSGIVEVRAKTTGKLDYLPDRGEADGGSFLYIGRSRHFVRKDMKLYARIGDFVKKGDLIASGRVTHGDHIFVNKIKYHFTKPQRGDIIVFDTNSIDHPDIRKDTFYIKRCAGVPGDTISIRPPYLIVNGEALTDPYPFKRQLERDYQGVRGYQAAGFNARKRPALGTEEDVLALKDGEYLPLGDNTQSSLDGRYFGAIRQESLVGPAFMVYWPVSKRWGLVR